MRIFHWLMDWLFPGKCVFCGGLLSDQELDLCKSCREEAPLFPNRKFRLQFLDSFAAVWYYEGSVRNSLLRYKFRGARSYAACYGRMLAMVIQEQYPDGFDVLSWVPVSRLRKWRRGYDQARLLAEAVGQELGMRPVPLLKKVRHNPAQSGISDAALRQENVRDAYEVVSALWAEDTKILLVDDILTTGATASECARALKEAGAREVHCAAVAASRK